MEGLNFKWISDHGRLPDNLDCFEQKSIIEKIIQEKNTPNQNYVIVGKMDDCRIKERAYMVKMATAVILAIYYKCDWVKELLEAGATFRLLDTIKLFFYDQNKEYLDMGEVTLMEIMAFNWEIPDDIYNDLWLWAKEHCELPPRNFFQLRLVFDKEDDKRLLQRVLKLKMVWEEAADIALAALINYFSGRMETVGEELYKLFPDKLRELTLEIIEMQILEKYYLPMNHQQLTDLKSSMYQIWALYKKYTEKEEHKETVVQLMEKIIKKNSWKFMVEWIIGLVLEGVDDFGEILVEQRGICVQELLKHEAVSKVVWSRLVRAGFVPIEEMDYYIEYARKKNQSVIPFLMIAKYKKRL